MLTRLAVPSNGVQRLMAVLSNKPVKPSRDIVQALGLGDFFVRVYGGNNLATKKPHPLGVGAIPQGAWVAAELGVVFCDSSIRISAGRKTGVWAFCVMFVVAPQKFV